MANNPLGLLEPFLSLYGIDPSDVAELRLTAEQLYVVERDKDTAIMREITIREWRNVLPPVDASSNNFPPSPDATPSPRRDIPVDACEHGRAAYQWCPGCVDRRIASVAALGVTLRDRTN